MSQRAPASYAADSIAHNDAQSTPTLDELLAENARLRSDLRLRECALNAISAGIMIFDMQSKGRPIVYANRASAERMGYSMHELIGEPSAQLTPRELNGDRGLQVRDAMQAGRSIRVELITARKDGGKYWAGLTLTPVFAEARKLTHYVSTSTDITSRRAAEQQNQRDRERLAAVVESALDGVIAVDSTFHITLFNRAAENIFGHAAGDLLGQPLELLLPERFRATHFEHIRRFAASAEAQRDMNSFGSQDSPGSLFGLRANGEEFPIEASISRVSVGDETILTIILRDISERVKAQGERLRLESQLRLAQKLEAVGQLASGIAHEINTPIQYVGDSVNFLKTARDNGMKVMQAYRHAIVSLEQGATLTDIKETIRVAEQAADIEFYETEVPDAFQRTLQGVERVANIVRAMKEFSHPDAGDHQEADINRALETTLVVARNEYKYVATVTTDFQELPLIACNIGELNQVFLNLIVNAAHAVGDTGQEPQTGRIDICTALDGDFVKVSISDNGCGIPRSNLDKVFDPFFTTKEVGKGTGQGLAIARSIVVIKHRGSIDIESNVGRGTTFTLRIPIGDKSATETVI